MTNKTKVNGRTLNQFVQELKEEGCVEITRILPQSKTSFVVEYEVERPFSYQNNMRSKWKQ